MLPFQNEYYDDQVLTIWKRSPKVAGYHNDRFYGQRCFNISFFVDILGQPPQVFNGKGKG